MDPIVGKKIAGDGFNGILDAGTYEMRFKDMRQFGKNVQRDPATGALLNVMGYEFEFVVESGPTQERGLNPVGRSWKWTIYKPVLDADGNDPADKKKGNDYNRKLMDDIIKFLDARNDTADDGTFCIDFSGAVDGVFEVVLGRGKDKKGNDVNYLNKCKRTGEGGEHPLVF